MNTLPTELEDIIYKYTHQLKMNDVLEELCQSFSQCDYCYDDKPHKHLLFCHRCSIEFCKDCQGWLEDTSGRFCNGCYFERRAFGEIERILGRKLESDELTTVMDLFDSIDEDEKENISDYLRYLRYSPITFMFEDIIIRINPFFED